MKRLLALVLAFFLLFGFLFSVAAEEDRFDRSYTRFNDYADAVSEEEASLLNAKVRAKLDEIQMDFPICVFLKRNSETTLSEFGDDFYARNHFGCGEDKSGILLVLDLQNAKFNILYYGEADTLIGDDMRETLSDSFIADCRDDDLSYYQLFDRYYDNVFQMVEEARTHPTTTRFAAQDTQTTPMPDWYPENTDGFEDFHGEDLPTVVDDAHIFTEEQMQTLSDKIRSVNERLGIGYVAFTSDDNHGLMPEEYSSDFLHFNGYGVGDGYGAVVFYLSLDPSDRCWLTTSINSYEPLFNADVTYEIDEMVDSSIRGGEYYEAFLMHADYVESLFSNFSEDLPSWYPEGTRTYDLDRSDREFAAKIVKDAPRIVDNAGALSPTQLQDYSDALKTLTGQYALDIVIFTDASCRAPKGEQYADDFYYYNGYAADGILFYMVNTTDTPSYGILFYGKGEQYLNLNLIGRVQSLIQNKKTDRAIEKYMKLINFVLRHQRLPLHPAAGVFCLIVGVVVGLIVASLVLDQMKRKMVITRQISARSYLVDGSFRLFGKSHDFLYSDVTRTAKPKETSSSGSSSSGSSRGGSTHTSGHSAGGSYSSGGRRF